MTRTIRTDNPTHEIARQVAGQHRFFHWELEFPDVFNAATHGFDAILGNPPWGVAKPNSKEFFSAFDPMYRGYGKQEALCKQTEYFDRDESIERQWLDYSAFFKGMSNWVKYVGVPFGDRVTQNSQGKQSHDFNIGDRGRSSFATSQRRHERWKRKREEATGYADAEHSFRHQGSADINLYKLFVEQAHALLAEGGRLGLIVPSGLYSDFGTGDLRRLFVDHCRWEWLFGFENREGIFDIHRSFKFNPIIVAKGGQTRAIRTAFMRRSLADWENAEQFATEYTLSIAAKFSPDARAILEISHDNDVVVLGRMFANSILASSDALQQRKTGFAKGDFDMVSGSKHFVARRAVEPADEFGRIVNVEKGDTFLPLYEGRMIGPFTPSKKGWTSGRGRTAVWRDIAYSDVAIEPQWLVSTSDISKSGKGLDHPRLGFIRVTSSTNERTVIASVIPPFPTGFTACQLQPASKRWSDLLYLCSVLNSFALDFAARRRVCSLDVAWFHVRDFPLPRAALPQQLLKAAASLNFICPSLSDGWLAVRPHLRPHEGPLTAVTDHERTRLRVGLDCCIGALFGLTEADFRWIVNECDLPVAAIRETHVGQGLNPKGFWRVDKTKHPEHRQTVLSLIAFHDLQDHITACGGDVTDGIEAFCNQNDGEGWMLPETLRLADYGLGHDERAKEPQPVRECFGPRFYDWQLAQSPEESWRECHLHARNLLGPEGYQALLDEIEGRTPPREPSAESKKRTGQQKLFETEHLPLFPE